MRFGMYINFTFLVLSRKVVQSHSRYFRFYLGCHQLSEPPNLVEISFGFRSFYEFSIYSWLRYFKFIAYSNSLRMSTTVLFESLKLKFSEIFLWPWEFENLNWRIPIDVNNIDECWHNIIEVIINPRSDFKVYASLKHT